MALCKPKISVLILAYNQGIFIESTLKSVVGQRSENYELEIIVIDDGSSDCTADKVANFRDQSLIPMTFLAKPHQGINGIASNLLEMINMSNGDYIGFLAGDDEYTSRRFRKQLELFEKNPRLQIIYADGVSCTDGHYGAKCHSEDVRKLLESGCKEAAYKYVTSRIPVIFIQGVLARSEFLKQLQPFDTDLVADDWVFNIKVFDCLRKNCGEFSFTPEIAFVRNIHGNNTSRNISAHYLRISQVADRYCENSREIKSKFISNGLMSAIITFNLRNIRFLSLRALVYPESFLYFSKRFVGIFSRKLMNSLKPRNGGIR